MIKPSGAQIHEASHEGDILLERFRILELPILLLPSHHSQPGSSRRQDPVITRRMCQYRAHRHRVEGEISRCRQSAKSNNDTLSVSNAGMNEWIDSRFHYGDKLPFLERKGPVRGIEPSFDQPQFLASFRRSCRSISTILE